MIGPGQLVAGHAADIGEMGHHPGTVVQIDQGHGAGVVLGLGVGSRDGDGATRNRDAGIPRGRLTDDREW